MGGLLSLGISAQIVPTLRRPLVTALPEAIQGLPGTDANVSEAEAQVAGFTDYALRVYQSADTTQPSQVLSVYLGYYDRQTRGRTIHSPKNCLPGGGWEALESGPETLQVDGGSVTVNRYMLQNGNAQAMVLYWYQGRGRVAHNEYLVKWDLLRDAITKRRTDEALVRIVVNVQGSPEAALELARQVAIALKPAVDQVLPL
ncbi:MAG: EpsI family protein [Gemmatimonadetes bacterium]|nr:EpsI family protein [Gemmatimonadota bacterium]